LHRCCRAGAIAISGCLVGFGGKNPAAWGDQHDWQP
jgi:hypothetical protein